MIVTDKRDIFWPNARNYFITDVSKDYVVFYAIKLEGQYISRFKLICRNFNTH